MDARLHALSPNNLVSACALSGALNEAYSNIFGEVVDQINGPGQRRAGRSRGSTASALRFRYPLRHATRAERSTPPAPIARDSHDRRGPARAAAHGPAPWPGDLVLANETASGQGRASRTLPAPTAAAPDRRSRVARARRMAQRGRCRAKIALVDRGTCPFAVTGQQNAPAPGRRGRGDRGPSRGRRRHLHDVRRQRTPPSRSPR